ncbi:hypothetical protein SPONN_219 [uncultured Candidatus Thioglobus sp.]|nr:hypothetical protein SPONN_219 [uncultured Candidatus Thioglobus sp.]
MDAFLHLDAFDDIIVEAVEAEVAVRAEVEVGADVVKPKKRRTKLLKKAEKQVLIDKIKAVARDCDEAVSTIVKAVDAEDHIHIFKDREEFWNRLRLEHIPLSTIFVGLVDLFASVFKSCERGKDRYTKFQVQWHRNCCFLLADKIDEASTKEVSTLHELWLGYCGGYGVARRVHNPVMISLCSAVYDYLMQELFTEQKERQQASTDSAETCSC